MAWPGFVALLTKTFPNWCGYYISVGLHLMQLFWSIYCCMWPGGHCSRFEILLRLVDQSPVRTTMCIVQHLLKLRRCFVRRTNFSIHEVYRMAFWCHVTQLCSQCVHDSRPRGRVFKLCCFATWWCRRCSLWMSGWGAVCQHELTYYLFDIQVNDFLCQYLGCLVFVRSEEGNTCYMDVGRGLWTT